ncbi:MAG: molybdopterin-guanine dinucleotide biosynthesis protein A [Chloroflexi bacterium]|nr:MAG: molybdopterin-guanine dinucleotide biosynthesis protein A [Chloroflexota bacterium]MBA4375327.1 hypothetical protein [Anaerolinea sp.]
MLTVGILAGGRSQRMGQNKALMLFHGIPLIQRVANRVSSTATEINIISNEEPLYKFLNLPIFPDQIPQKGVLGGILTAFLRAGQSFVAPVGCDLPFISPALLNAELKIILESDVDIVIPESKNGLEPLHAVYRRSTCLPLVEKSILRGDNRIISWFDHALVRTLVLSEVSQFDPDPHIFLNLNYPDDFKQAEELSEQE